MSAAEQPGGADPVAALQAVLAGAGRPPTEVVSYADTMNELLGAIRACASAARSVEVPQERDQLGKAALAFGQTWVIMHPDLIAPAGVTADKMPQQQVVPGGGPSPKGAGTTTGRPPQPTARRGSGEVKD